jgi:hypothetical protein
MRYIVSIFASIAVLVSSGCAVIEKESTNRGGYVDYLLDEHWTKADSKSMRALRAFAIQVSLARVASVSAKNDSDRQLLAIRIGALTKRFTPVYACAFDSNPLGVPGAEADPCFYYDSAMVDYSTGLFDLAMVALPVDDAKRLITAATGAIINPINLADLLDALLAIGKDALKYGRVVGALYRDTIELEVQLWLGTPAIDDRPPPYRVTESDVAALREIYARRNDDMPAWLAAIAALRSQGLEPMPQRKFFAELGGLMKYICSLITQESAALQQCQAGLPTTMPPARPALGSGTRVVVGRTIAPVSQAIREGIPSSPREKLSVPDNKPSGPMVSGAKPGPESNIPPSVFDMIQANLCVAPTTRFDTDTREAIRQAKIAARQGPNPLFNNIANEIKSDLETQAFADAGNCKDSHGYLTAFEKFRFGDRAAMDDLRRRLRLCDRNFNLPDSDSFDPATRSAIMTVKAKAPAAAQAKFGDATSGKLNDASYAYIVNNCIARSVQP